MKRPAITVLMPVYNGERYLTLAIESILHQTFSDFELLIVNDASTDATMRILSTIDDPRIRIVSNEKNCGLTASLNIGLQNARADLIARMDADDISHPERLSVQYEYMTANHDCALLSAAAVVVDNAGIRKRIDRYNPAHFYYNLNFICWIYHSSVIYRRSVVENLGMYTSEFSEDFDLWWRISRENRFHHLNEVLIDYRETGDSLSHMTRKEEYDLAQRNQVVRNIHFYTQQEMSLTIAEVEAFRFNFKPLLLEGKVPDVKLFFEKLAYITECIVKMPNINLVQRPARQAGFNKFIFSFFSLAGKVEIFDAFRIYLRGGGGLHSVSLLREIINGVDELAVS